MKPEKIKKMIDEHLWNVQIHLDKIRTIAHKEGLNTSSFELKIGEADIKNFDRSIDYLKRRIATIVTEFFNKYLEE